MTRSPIAEYHSTQVVAPSRSGANCLSILASTTALPSCTVMSSTEPAGTPLTHTGEPLTSCAADGMTSFTW